MGEGDQRRRARDGEVTLIIQPTAQSSNEITPCPPLGRAGLLRFLKLLFQIANQVLQALLGEGIVRLRRHSTRLSEPPFQFLPVAILGHCRSRKEDSDAGKWFKICGRLFGLGVQASDAPIALPQFNIVAINQLLGGFDCCGVISTVQPLGLHEMTVMANDVNAVIRHNPPFPWIRREHETLSHRKVPRTER
jgi:hypothetical protein